VEKLQMYINAIIAGKYVVDIHRVAVLQVEKKVQQIQADIVILVEKVNIQK